MGCELEIRCFVRTSARLTSATLKLNLNEAVGGTEAPVEFWQRLRRWGEQSIVLCFYTVELPAGRLTKSAKLELIDKVFHEHDLEFFPVTSPDHAHCKRRFIFSDRNLDRTPLPLAAGSNDFRKPLPWDTPVKPVYRAGAERNAQFK